LIFTICCVYHIHHTPPSIPIIPRTTCDMRHTACQSPNARVCIPSAVLRNSQRRKSAFPTADSPTVNCPVTQHNPPRGPLILSYLLVRGVVPRAHCPQLEAPTSFCRCSKFCYGSEHSGGSQSNPSTSLYARAGSSCRCGERQEPCIPASHAWVLWSLIDMGQGVWSRRVADRTCVARGSIEYKFRFDVGEAQIGVEDDDLRS
jgi:hypothetical protein